MNMVRIRRIMEMRKELKAPPLLPPKLKKSSLDSMERRGGAGGGSLPREILMFHFTLRNMAVSTPEMVVTVHESEGGGVEGPWRMVANSEVFSAAAVVDLPSLFSIQFMFESVQPLRIELCVVTEDSVSPLAATIFTLAQALNAPRLARPLINDTDGACLAYVDIRCTLKARPPPIQVTFEGRDFSKRLLPDSAMVFIEIREVVPSTTSSSDDAPSAPATLYRSEGAKNIGGRAAWRPAVIALPDDEEDAEGRDRAIEVVVSFRDEKTRAEGMLGWALTSMAELQRDPTQGNTYYITNPSYKDGAKSTGTLDVVRSTTVAVPSFLEYIMTGHTMHVSFAIDFSSTDEQPFTPAYLADVNFTLEAIGDCIADYSSTSVSGYGFGGLIPAGGFMRRESQQFCLNLETNPSFDYIKGVQDAFASAATKVLPSKTSQISHIIYYLSKLAQNAQARRANGSSQYFVLVIITKGVVHDLKEAVQAVIFASRCPISIVLIGLGDGKMNEMVRLGTAGMRLAFQGRKVTRDCVHFVNAKALNRSEPSTEEDRSALSERALYRLTPQMTTFLSRHVPQHPTLSPRDSVVDDRASSSSSSAHDFDALDTAAASQFDYGDGRRSQSPNRAARHSLESSSESGGFVDAYGQRLSTPATRNRRAVSPSSFPRLNDDLRSMSITESRRIRPKI